MANRKNYGLPRTERLCIRLTKKEKGEMQKIARIYKKDVSDTLRLMIHSYAEYFSGDEKGYIKRGMTDADI